MVTLSKAFILSKLNYCCGRNCESENVQRTFTAWNDSQKSKLPGTTKITHTLLSRVQMEGYKFITIHRENTTKPGRQYTRRLFPLGKTDVEECKISQIKSKNAASVVRENSVYIRGLILFKWYAVDPLMKNPTLYTIIFAWKTLGSTNTGNPIYQRPGHDSSSEPSTFR